MTLEEYLKEAYPDTTWARACAAFAERVGSTRQTIDRYARFLIFPPAAMQAMIRKETRGLVAAAEDHLPPQHRETAEERRRRRRPEHS